MTESPSCPDGFFHARYAYLLPERGLDRTLPWLQFTSLKDAYFDNHFLYNVLLVPFCRLASEPLVGVKIATLILELALLLVLYVVLWRLRVPWPLFWMVLLGVGGGLFLDRFLMPRSHVLSMSLMILSLYAILKQRVWLAFGLGFVYVWSYSAPIAVLCTVVGAELAQLALTGWPRRWPRMSVAIGLGLLAGHVIHPYSPLTIDALVAMLHVTRTAALGRGEVELGTEYLPVSPRDLWAIAPGYTLAILFAVGGAVWLRFRQRARLSAETAAAVGAATGWFCGIFLFMRVIEYAAPVSMVAAGLVARDLWGERVEFLPQFRNPKARTNALLALAVAVGLLVSSQFWTFGLVRVAQLLPLYRGQFLRESDWRRGRYFDGVAAWMKSHVRSGATVVNINYDDFPELFYSAPEQYYVTGMDPTLLRLAHPELSDLLENMRTQRTPLDFAALRRSFKSEFLVVRTYRAMQYPQLRPGLATREGDGVRPVYKDCGGVIYYLGEGTPPLQ